MGEIQDKNTEEQGVEYHVSNGVNQQNTASRLFINLNVTFQYVSETLSFIHTYCLLFYSLRTIEGGTN